MCLERADIETTLRVVEARSVPGSRLVVMYTSPSIIRRMRGFFLGRMDEPVRSPFTADEMRTLLAGLSFTVVLDDELPRIAGRLLTGFGEATRFPKDMRIATAERR